MLRKLSTAVVVFAVAQAIWADAAHAQVYRASPGLDGIPSVYLISSGERSTALVATPDGVTLDIDDDVLVRTDSDSDGNANVVVIKKDTIKVSTEVWSDSPLRGGDRIVVFEQLGTDHDTGETFYWVSVQEPNHYLFLDLANDTIMVVEFSGILGLVTREKPQLTERNHRETQSHPSGGAHLGIRLNENMSGNGRDHAARALVDACFQLGHEALPAEDLKLCQKFCDDVDAPVYCTLDSCYELCLESFGL